MHTSTRKPFSWKWARPANINGNARDRVIKKFYSILHHSAFKLRKIVNNSSFSLLLKQELSHFEALKNFIPLRKKIFDSKVAAMFFIQFFCSLGRWL